MKTIEIEKLDCGHPLDEGRPANVAGKTIQGWQFVLTDDGRKICHSCANKTILDCGHPPSPHELFTTGYGVDAGGKKICYTCCAENDKKAMRENGKICLYLTTKPDMGGSYGNAEISNWPGSLKITGRYHRGAHNIARTRYDVWFTFEGSNWHGVTYGENTQICHCRKLKK